MIDREQLRAKIQSHVDGFLTLEDLAAWAEEVFRGEDFEARHAEQIATVLSVIRDAVDPHRFRWEEPDFEALIDELSV